MLLAALLVFPTFSWSKSKSKKNPVVELTTTSGKINIELFPAKAPKTVANFLAYVKAGHYTGTVFHRVINNFMIQGGGFDTKLKKKETRAPIKNEAHNGLKNKLGTVAMARTPNPHSAAAQFFINVKDNDFLNHTGKTVRGWGYCVFGKVIKGMDVVNKIKTVKTGAKGPFSQDAPQENVVIKKAIVLK
jgi:cyclophilin family peptidyl-prolyl cis-trans isomerase